LFFASALAQALPAGQSPASSGQQQPPTFRSAARLVQVTVIVHDRDRKPVAGLTREDFQLQEDGKDQRIEAFSAETRTSTASAEPVPAPGNTFTNRLGEAAAGVTVILLDRVNTSIVDQMSAREHTLKLLEGLGPGDRVGLYLLDGSDAIKVLHDFTNDSESLRRVVARYRARDSRELAAVEDMAALGTPGADSGLTPELIAWLQDVDERLKNELTRDRIVHTSNGLQTIARRLSGVRGRKNLIWVTGAFPIVVAERSGSRVFTPELNPGLRALNDAHVAVYPVDARRLQGAFASRPADKQQVFHSINTTNPDIETMQLVAEDTGGRAFYNTNDLRGAMRRALDDSQIAYVLGYYPANDKWDGKFRQIRVRVNRRGMEVRHRRGYLATASPSDDAATRTAALRDALLSPLAATGVELTVGVAAPPEAGAGDVDVTVRVEPRTVTLEREGDRWRGTVDLLIAQIVPDGTLYANIDVSMGLDLTDEQRDRALAEGLSLTRRIALRGDAHQIRVVARDVRSGATGSVIVPVSAVKKGG
jgi:VWFA-related protein